MRHDETRGRRRDTGRWEPAEDGEHRRWHGDEDERHGGRRGRSRGREHFAGPFGGPGFGPGFAGPEMHGPRPLAARRPRRTARHARTAGPAR